LNFELTFVVIGVSIRSTNRSVYFTTKFWAFGIFAFAIMFYFQVVIMGVASMNFQCTFIGICLSISSANRFIIQRT